jgi:periplasmic copper chaperone A
MTMMQRKFLRVGIWCLLSSSFACAPGWANAQVTVSDAWVRGTAGPQDSSGAFMTIHSLSDVDLVRVRSPIAASASVHETKMSGDMMKMRPVPRLRIAAGRSVELKPGAYHVMLEGLKSKLTKGDSVPIVLTFEGADKRRFQVTAHAQVRALGEGNPPMRGMGNMPGMK